jgi:hypothetical protein
MAVTPPHNMDALFYFGMFFLSGLTQWKAWKRIAREVNQYLPAGEEYPTSRWAFSPRSLSSPMNQIKLWRLHRQFFPESYLRWVILATWVLMIVFWVLCWQFDRVHSVTLGG